MKKTLLTILCVLTALCGMAQSERTYTEQLVITTGEESSDPQEASILVVDNGDQTINFVLKNFILSSGGSDIPVGNIVVNNLPVTKGEDGLDHVSYDGRISITPGDLDGVVSWFGPMFGQIPIVLEGKMNEEKLYVSIDINIGGSIVNVLLGTDDFFVTIVTGDLNGDAAVDIADAVSVLNIMSEGGYSQVADINGDDKVDIADFVGILDIMAEQ